MNPFIETANQLGERFLYFAWPMFWQSSLLIIVLFAVDFVLRRRLRASVRYALWLVVLVKLLLPPTLALPTSITWWTNRPALIRLETHKTAVVTYDQAMPAEAPIEMPALAPVSPLPPVLSRVGWFVVASSVITILLLVWLATSWLQIARTIRRAVVGSPEMEAILMEVKKSIHVRQTVRLRFTSDAMSPAVCGLFRPTILMPAILAERLSPEQLRAVLLHELIHLRRGDVWMNCAQTLIQIAYWWNPLLWLANHRIRRIREEAVDDAVMLALSDVAETYAPTLLEVAKVAISRPLAGLRMVGILESRGALRQRIERLINFRAPRQAGLTLVSGMGIIAFSALAVPMGEGPARLATITTAPVSQTQTNSWPDPHFSGYENIDLQPQFLIADEARLRATLPGIAPGKPVAIQAEELAHVQHRLKEAGAVTYNGAIPLGFQIFSGGRYHLQIGGCTNSICTYNVEGSAKQTRVLGADYQSPATQPDWSQLDLLWTPWKEQGAIRSQMKLALGGNSNITQDAEISIPSKGAMAWVIATSPGKCQIVLLTPSPVKSTAANASTNGLSPSVDNTPSSTNSINSLDDRRRTFDALKKIEISGIGFRNDRLAGALSILEAMVSTPPPLKEGTITFTAEKKIRNVLIRINPPLGRVTAAALLDAIVKGSSEPIHYVVTDRAVVFLADDSGWPLQVQTFTVKPDIFLANARREAGLTDTNSANDTAVLQAVFSKAGLDFEPPKSFYYIPTGTIMFRTTTNDFSAIETVLHRLSFSSSPDISAPDSSSGDTTNALQVRWFKVDPHALAKNLNVKLNMGATNVYQGLIAALRESFQNAGVELTKPKSMFFNDRNGVLIFRATASDLDTLETLLQQLNHSLPLVNIKTRFIELPDALANSLLKDVLLTSNNVPANGFSALLLPGDAKKLIERCASASDVKIIGEPEVTTLSDRQAKIEQCDVMTLVKGIKPEALTPPGLTNDMFYQTEMVDNGETVDFIPKELKDEYTIQLSAVPMVREFLGYEGGKTNLSNFRVYVNGKRQTATLAIPRPHFRTRTMAANATLLDGQSLLLGGAPWIETSTKADGTTVTNTPKDFSHKQLFVLITPVLTDPAGNRVHTNEEMSLFSKANPQAP